jgi:hypothetical protein
MPLNLPSKAQIFDALTPALVWGLTLACPACPAWVWTILIKALLSGDISLDNIKAFMVLHNLHTYPEYPVEKDGDFEKMPPAQGQPNSNINQRA